VTSFRGTETRSPVPCPTASVVDVKPLRALLLYLAVVFIGAAILAPWAHGAVQHLAPATALARHPFHRYVSRCLLGLALAGLWPLVRALGVRSWPDIGWRPRSGWSREAGAGLAVGFVSLAAAAAASVLFGGRDWRMDHPAPDWGRHLSNATLAAFAVSILEELLFRGAVFTALRRTGSFASTAIVTSGIYALVHFFQKPPSPAVVGPLSGFVVLGQMLHGFTMLRDMVPGLVTLALAGGLLAWARERTGALWFSIGMHAGWIFWLKSFGFLTQAAPDGPSRIWGTDKLYDGWAATVVLAAVALLLATRWPRPTATTG